MELYKYQGAGNDFIIADNRDGRLRPTATEISDLCDRHYGLGADGLMLLETVPGHDFRMVYYNSDGSGGMMCGNGGRCIVAFASDLGIAPSDGRTYSFIADDGPHSAEILAPGSQNADLTANRDALPDPHGVCKTVRLKMADVDKITNIDVKSFFLNTGTRHFVKFVNNLSTYNVLHEGRIIRHLPQFGPVGTNVNFAEAEGDTLMVRTYEKGVEDETFACGTGITACAIAALRYYGLDPDRRADYAPLFRRETIPAASPASSAPGAPAGPSAPATRIHVSVRAVRDSLAVDFIETPSGAADVWLTGPATFVCRAIF